MGKLSSTQSGISLNGYHPSGDLGALARLTLPRDEAFVECAGPEVIVEYPTNATSKMSIITQY